MIGALSLLAAGILAGQGAQAVSRGDSIPGSELTVYLLTFEPGELVWERFGHNAVWIRDGRSGEDIAFDYGRFSFGRTFPDLLRFVGKFAIGEMRYSMGAADAAAVVTAYQRAGRKIWAQELDLEPSERAALRDFLHWNYRPEHRDYDYNYYLDNCSTRIRDALDRVLGGTLRRWADTVRTPLTYRDHTRRTTENMPLTYTALMLGLGRPVDHPLTAWEEMFLPISLRPYLDQVTVERAGGRRPLVREERLLVDSDRFAVAPAPASWTGRFLLVGVALGGLLWGLGRLGRRSSRWRFGFGALAVAWALLAGLGGAVLAALWAFTDHRFSYANENLLQLNLVSLALALLLPAAIWRGARHRVVARLAAVAVLASAAGLLLKVVPGFSQANGDMIALVLPIHLGLLAGLLGLGLSLRSTGGAPRAPRHTPGTP